MSECVMSAGEASPEPRRMSDRAMTAEELVWLYEQFGGRLAQIVGGCVNASEAVIEDACQAAWTQLIWNRQRVMLRTAPGWLVRTGLHEARRLTRLESREPSLELEVAGRSNQLGGATSAEPDELLAQRERLRTVSALPDRQQRLIWLRALGFTHDEMAWHERCTTRTVHRQLDRARRRLRILEESGVKGCAGRP